MSILVLRGQHSFSWDVSRLLGPDRSLPYGELDKLIQAWNRTPPGQRHELCLRLRSEHPREFAEAGRRLVELDSCSFTTGLRCAIYLPELWPRVAPGYAALGKLGADPSLEQEFAGATDDFLESVPEPIYRAMLPHLAEAWWWNGSWSTRRQQAATRLDARKACLQLAMLAGDAKRVAEYLGADRKREGYAMVWDFLQGKSHEAYLALRKLIGRRKEHIAVFEGWVALWAHLVALSQGDKTLFLDRRLGGTAAMESAFFEVDLDVTPIQQQVHLGRGLIDAALWIARQHHQKTLRMTDAVRDYWKGQGLSLLAEQLQEQPASPLLPAFQREEAWRTFIRLLDTQSQLLTGAAAVSSKTTGGALLWHLFPPEIVFYNDKAASLELGPERLDG